MNGVLIIATLVALAIGFYLGREAGKAPGLSSCPKCSQRRFHYCGSCGVHFDDKDEPVSPREHPSWMNSETVPGKNRHR